MSACLIPVVTVSRCCRIRLPACLHVCLHPATPTCVAAKSAPFLASAASSTLSGCPISVAPLMASAAAAAGEGTGGRMGGWGWGGRVGCSQVKPLPGGAASAAPAAATGCSIHWMQQQHPPCVRPHRAQHPPSPASWGAVNSMKAKPVAPPAGVALRMVPQKENTDLSCGRRNEMGQGAWQGQARVRQAGRNQAAPWQHAHHGSSAGDSTQGSKQPPGNLRTASRQSSSAHSPLPSLRGEARLTPPPCGAAGLQSTPGNASPSAPAGLPAGRQEDGRGGQQQRQGGRVGLSGCSE